MQIINNYTLISINNCYRSYPNENLLLPVRDQCKNNPFPYSYSWNSSSRCLNLTCLLNIHKKKNRILFLSAIDDNSFKYILNLHKVFIEPHNIRSFVTLVFYKDTLQKCNKYRIYCIYHKWPKFLDDAKDLDVKKKLSFLKYYVVYSVIKSGVSLLFINSDVLFINNCLYDILNRKEEVVLLKSHLSRSLKYGNSGIIKMRSTNDTKEMLKYGVDYIRDYIEEEKDDYLGDDEVISLALNRYKSVTRGLYDLPLFTVGLPTESDIKSLCMVYPINKNKEFSLKERLLYYVNENNYYSSKINKYVLFSRHLVDNNLKEITEICKRYNLVVILPDQHCNMPNCIYEMKNSFGDLSLMNHFINNNINIRESISFFIFFVYKFYILFNE